MTKRKSNNNDHRSSKVRIDAALNEQESDLLNAVMDHYGFGKKQAVIEGLKLLEEKAKRSQKGA